MTKKPSAPILYLPDSPRGLKSKPSLPTSAYYTNEAEQKSFSLNKTAADIEKAKLTSVGKGSTLAQAFSTPQPTQSKFNSETPRGLNGIKLQQAGNGFNNTQEPSRVSVTSCQNGGTGGGAQKGGTGFTTQTSKMLKLKLIDIDPTKMGLVESIGYRSTPGKVSGESKVNQDSVFISNTTIDGAFIIGVFDGHGQNGHRVSNFLSLNLEGRIHMTKMLLQL